MMWTKNRAKSLKDLLCEHASTGRGSYAGLERSVCDSCGHVSVRYVEDVIVDDIILAEELPLSETIR